MVLRKITIDISVRYVKKSEQTPENKPNMMKNKKQSEQIKNISRNSKTIVEDFAAGGFGILN